MQSVTPAQHRQAILMLLLANLLWGVSFPLVKAMAFLQEQLVPGSSSWLITATTLVPRFAFSALLIGGFGFRHLRGITRREWSQAVGMGGFTFLGMMFQNDGLQYTSASTSAFLTQFYAIMIPVFLALRSRRAPPWTVWVSCALVIAGVAVLARLDWRDLRLGRGELETLVSSVFFMMQILWLGRADFVGNRVLPVTFLMFAIEGALGLGMLAMTLHAGAHLAPLATNLPWIGCTLALTLLCTLGAFTLMNMFQPRITTTEAGVLYCCEPVFTALFALFLPGLLATWGGVEYANEETTRTLLLGGGLITAANLLIQVRGRKAGARSGE